MKERKFGAFHCLSSGSVRKGISLLFTNKGKDIQRKAIAGIKDALNQSCLLCGLKRDPTFKRASHNEMNRLSTMELSECLEKAASFTWNALNVKK